MKSPISSFFRSLACFLCELTSNGKSRYPLLNWEKDVESTAAETKFQIMLDSCL
jgi:hypothetical protein